MELRQSCTKPSIYTICRIFQNQGTPSYLAAASHSHVLSGFARIALSGFLLNGTCHDISIDVNIHVTHCTYMIKRVSTGFAKYCIPREICIQWYSFWVWIWKVAHCLGASNRDRWTRISNISYIHRKLICPISQFKKFKKIPLLLVIIAYWQKYINSCPGMYLLVFETTRKSQRQVNLFLIFPEIFPTIAFALVSSDTYLSRAPLGLLFVIYHDALLKPEQSEQTFVNTTHWGRDKMNNILLTTHVFSSMKTFQFRSKFHWSLFLRVQSTIFQHWFR